MEVAAYKQRGVKAQYADEEQNLEQISVQLGAQVRGGAVVVTAAERNSSESHWLTVVSGDVRFVDNVIGNNATAMANDIRKPWRYLHSAVAASRPGDQVVVRGTGVDWDDDSDSGRWCIISVEGTEGHPIIITGYPGETVISRHGIGHWQSDGDTILSNFKIDMQNTAPLAISLRGGLRRRLIGVEIVNTNIDQAKEGAITAPGVRFSQILGVYVHNAGGNEYNHGMYIQESSSDVEVGWCKVDSVTGGNGIQFFGGTNRNLSVHNTIVRNAGKYCLTFSATPTGFVTVRDSFLYSTTNAPCLYIHKGDPYVTIRNVAIENTAGVAVQVSNDVNSLTMVGNSINTSGSGMMQKITADESKITAYRNSWIPGPAPSFEQEAPVDPRPIPPSRLRIKEK